MDGWIDEWVDGWMFLSNIVLEHGAMLLSNKGETCLQHSPQGLNLGPGIGSRVGYHSKPRSIPININVLSWFTPASTAHHQEEAQDFWGHTDD